jgi:hypothetical protein
MKCVSNFISISQGLCSVMWLIACNRHSICVLVLVGFTQVIIALVVYTVYVHVITLTLVSPLPCHTSLFFLSHPHFPPAYFLRLADVAQSMLVAVQRPWIANDSAKYIWSPSLVIKNILAVTDIFSESNDQNYNIPLRRGVRFCQKIGNWIRYIINFLNTRLFKSQWYLQYKVIKNDWRGFNNLSYTIHLR